MKKWGFILWGMLVILGGQAWAAGTESPPMRTLPAASPGKNEGKVIWTGKSDGFAIRWTTADLQARPLKKPGRLEFSAAQLARRGFQTFSSPSNLDEGMEHITYERKFTLLSVTGSIISLQDELYYNITPSAHPGGETRLTSIDLNRPGEAVYVTPPEADEFELDMARLGKVAKLTDYFQENEVLKALLNNAVIQEAVAGESPRSLAEFFDLPKELRINEIPYLIPRDLLTRFAFHHLEGNKLAVCLSLPSAGGAARFMHAEIEILLPVPAGLKDSLSKTAAGKEGFLLKDRKKFADEGVTLISFSFDRKAKRK